MMLPPTRCVRLNRFGGPDVLAVEELAVQPPRAGEVLVRVVAASLNPVDYKMRQGGYPLLPADKLPITLGRDLAGTIEMVGPGVSRWLVGDRVFAFIGQDRGAQAGQVIVREDELASVPDGSDMVEAAAVPLAAITAWQGLFNHGGLQPGQQVLIHGGGGGVGHLAVQLAVAKGARVAATCSGRDVAFVRGLGAETVIDYEAQRFEDEVRDVDVVFDLIGGETQRRSFAVLREGGILVSTLGQADSGLAAQHKVRLGPPYHAEPNAEQLAEVADMIRKGEVKVTVAGTFPLADVRAGHERLEGGGFRGKLVLTAA